MFTIRFQTKIQKIENVKFWEHVPDLFTEKNGKEAPIWGVAQFGEIWSIKAKKMSKNE